MEVAASAVGIVSLGIQVCQGLLTYYDGWKDYAPDFANARSSIVDLSDTLTLLKDSLAGEGLDAQRKSRVETCLLSTRTGLENLQKEITKFEKHENPAGLRKKALSELHRLKYPFRKDTLAKLRASVSEVREQLKLALDVLQFDVSQRAAALQRPDHLRQMVTWLNPADPWINHTSARRSCQDQTGQWLVKSDMYRNWKSGKVSTLWLHGKAGCGKTVLCSTVVEDIKLFCESCHGAEMGIFYFSFSDEHKQSYEDLVRSLVAQLAWKEPAYKMLSEAYKKPERSALAISDMEKILETAVASYETVYLLLDALDECPEEGECLEAVLEGMDKLTRIFPNIKTLATSRELLDIRESMEKLGAEQIAIVSSDVDADIQKYISSELANDRKLQRLDKDLKTTIERTIASKSDGMFRWAFCQLSELKKLKSMRPSYVKRALEHLPATLDATYARMLANVGDMYQEEALTVLRWVAYARSPLTLGELVDAVIIDAETDFVAFDDRGDFESPFHILSGLISLVADGSEKPKRHVDDSDNENRTDKEQSSREAAMDANARVQLAHFSVKEYLESGRVSMSPLKAFHLDPLRDNKLVALACLTYLRQYSQHSEKKGTIDDRTTFPLLKYTSQSWTHHSALDLNADFTAETDFLDSSDWTDSWLKARQLGRYRSPYESFRLSGNGVYHASRAGLDQVVKLLLGRGQDANARTEGYGSAIQAASALGHLATVSALLEHPTIDINIHMSGHDSALCLALRNGHEDIAALLLEAGADVNASSSSHGSLLHVATEQGQERLLEMLLEKGAHVDTPMRSNSTALWAAASKGRLECARILLKHGADVNFGDILEEALDLGHEQMAILLLESGADANMQSARHGNALQAASAKGLAQVVAALIGRGADVNARGGIYSCPLCDAASNGHQEIVKMLLEAGADVNAESDKDQSSALIEALSNRNFEIAVMLLAYGANVDGTSKSGVTPIGAAVEYNQEHIVRMLIERGADLSAKASNYGDALQTAAAHNQVGLVKLLVEHCADPSAIQRKYGSALSVAAAKGSSDFILALLQHGLTLDQSLDQNRALFAAVKGHQEDTALLLLSRVRMQATERQDLLRRAAGVGLKKVVTFLLDSGAFVDAETLGAAARGYDEQMTTMLIDRVEDFSWCGSTIPISCDPRSFRYDESILVAKLLLDKGASSDTYGGRLLCAAADAGQGDVVRILLDSGVDPNVDCDGAGGPLYLAVNVGSADIVAMLLDRGAAVDAEGGPYQTALCCAASDGNTEIVSMLLDSGADINKKGVSNGSALSKAVRSGRKETAALLLARGAEVNGTIGIYGTSLYLAVMNSHEETAIMLLEHGAVANSTQADKMLIRAVEKDWIQLAALLLQKGARANAKASREDDGCALHIASRRGFKDMAVLLLDHGADVNMQGSGYGSPLSMAIRHDRRSLARMLIERGANADTPARYSGDALTIACEKGFKDIVMKLLEGGVNGNAEFCLIAAASEGQSSICEMLLNRGVNPNTQSALGGSALCRAAERGDLDMVLMLLEAGADVNLHQGRYKCGNALCGALYSKQHNITQVLLDHGADVNSSGNKGNALYIACETGQWRSVSALLERGARVNELGGKFGYGLQSAAYHGYEDIVHMLLEAGADVNAKRGEHGTALDAAVKQGHERIVTSLLQKGAQINTDKDQLPTTLYLASAGGHARIATLLLERGAPVSGTQGKNGSPLRAALKGNHRGMAIKFLERGAEADQGSLRFCAKHGDLDMVTLLLRHGAIVDAHTFVSAARIGHGKMTELLLNHDVDINAPDDDGHTALEAAVSRYHRRETILLLERGASIEPGQKEYVLQTAARTGQEQLVCELLQRGADPNAMDDTDGSAIAAAAGSGHKRIVDLLLQHGADINAAGRSGRSPLCLSLTRLHKEVSLFLLEKGADVNKPTGHSQTMLEIALRNGPNFESIVRKMVEMGADGNALSENYGTVLPIFAVNGQEATLAMVLERQKIDLGDEKNIGNAFCFMALYGQQNALTVLLDKGVNIDALGQSGTALEAAARTNHEEAVKLLLDRGANVDLAIEGGKTPLGSAIEQKHESVALLLLDSGADSNSISGADTVLQLASSWGSDAVVKALLEKGAAVNMQTETRQGNALCAAAISGHKSIVSTLLDWGADVNLQGGHYANALSAAFESNQRSIAMLLLDRGANVDGPAGENYAAILQKLSQQGDKTAVIDLLVRGADVNAPGGKRGNALQTAVLGGHVSLAETLIERGAIIDAHDGKSWGTALELAACLGDEKMVSMLLDHGADVNAFTELGGGSLNAAAERGIETLVAMLLDRGADVDARGSYGTALHVASQQGHKKVVAMLIKRGAKANGYDPTGGAIMAAAEYGHTEIVSLLLDAGADPSAANGSLCTALQAAAYDGYDMIVSRLIKGGADIHAESGRCGNALFAASSQGHSKIVKVLQDAGFDFGRITTDSLGRTKLLRAAAYGFKAGVETCLAEKQDVNAVDNHNWTALHWAAYFDHLEIADFLLKSGANKDQVDWQGWTAGRVAAFCDHKETAVLLSYEAPPDEDKEGVERTSAYCDACSHNLTQGLYHCTQCPESTGFDLCFRCVRDADKVHEHGNDAFTDSFRY